MPINLQSLKYYRYGYYFGLLKYFKYFYKSDCINYFSINCSFNDNEINNFLDTYYLYEYSKINIQYENRIKYLLNLKEREYLSLIINQH